MDEGDKKFCKALSTDEIRKHAQDWTLAGDVGLLAHLEQFSEKICSRTQETNVQFNELLDNIDEVEKKISNTINQFLSLQNCQFVENRVYDEETPTEENIKEEVVDENERERLLLIQYKEAVEMGIKLLDTHFQEVELPPNSDSDEEETSVGNVSLIWKPKNPYSGKKFPLLIGSAEWWEDDSVGLRNDKDNLAADKVISESESDLESTHDEEKKIEISSSSSEEIEKSIPSRPNIIHASSEDLFGLEKNYNFSPSTADIFGVLANPTAAVLPNFSAKNQTNSINEEHSDGTTNEKDAESPTGYISKMNNSQKVGKTFKQELEAKLGSFSKDNIVGSAKEKPFEIRKEEEPFKNIVDEKPQINQIDSEDLFNESEEGDLFYKKINNEPLGNKNLFFDAENDAELFGGSNKTLFDLENNLFDQNNSKKSQMDSSQANQWESSQAKSIKPNESQKIGKDFFGDVFDDNELFLSEPTPSNSVNKRAPSNQNDIFNEEKPSGIEKGKEKKNKKTRGLFDDEFEDEEVKEASIFNSAIDQNEKQSLSKNEIFEPRPIFASSDDRAEDGNNQGSEDSFSSALKSHIVSGSESIDPVISEPTISKSKIDLFSNSVVEESRGEKRIPPVKLMDDDEDDLFLEKPKHSDSLSVSSSRSSLFEDVNSSKSRLASVFEKDKSHLFDDDLFNSSDNSLFGRTALSKTDESDLLSAKSKVAAKETDSNFLFGDDEGEDIFSQNFQIRKTFRKKSDPPLEVKKESKDEIDEPEVVDIFDGAASKKIDLWSTSSFNSNLTADNLFEEIFTVPKESNEETVAGKSSESVKMTKGFRSDSAIAEKKDKTPEIQVNSSEVKNSRITKIFSDPISLDDEEDLFGPGTASMASESTKPKPPDSLNLDKNLDQVAKAKRVGKLNIPQNLKQKLESAVVNSRSSETSGEVGAIFESKIEDLDGAPEAPSNLLKCPSKDRVKIPGRRKPQSRRARREAIRNSGTDFLIVESGNVESRQMSPATDQGKKMSSREESTSAKSPDNLFSSPLSNPLSPSTDEEDFLSVPELDGNYEKEEDRGMFKNNLFQSSKGNGEDCDDLLFDAAPRLSSLDSKNVDPTKMEKKEPEEEKDSFSIFESSRFRSDTKKVSIFEFDDDDLSGDENDDDGGENLFTSKNSIGKAKKGTVEKSGSVLCEKRNAKQSLFGIDADEGDDDLFGEKQNGGSSIKTPSENSTKPEVKTKSSQSFVDPLGLMSSNDE